MSSPLMGAELTSATGAAPLKGSSATLYATRADGETYFAVALKAQGLESKATTHQHVVLVDTSASQFGQHRTHALAVAREFLAVLPAGDEVLLVAVDVKAEPLMDAFAAPQSPAVETAFRGLKRRVPLGATNLPAGLQAAIEHLDGDASPSVVYIGDGMSTANLLETGELKSLLGELTARHIPVHSYAVGPRTDLQLLGTLGQFTGGMVMFDHGDEQKDSAAVIGSRLAAAVKAPIYFPEKLEVSPTVALQPNTALPVRADRETIYLGKGELQGELRIELVAGTTSLAFATDAGTAESGHAFLGTFHRQAEKTGGLTVSFAGEELLNAANQVYDEQVARMAAHAELAVAREDFRQAEQLVDTLRQVDPNNIKVKALLGAVRKGQAELPAQAAPPPPPGSDPNSLLNNPSLLPPAAPGAAGVGPTDLLAEEEQRRRVRGEQLAVQVNATIENARRIARDNPDAALADLKQIQNIVLATTDIHPEIRETLARRLGNTIRDVTNIQEVAAVNRIAAQERLAQLEAQQRLIEQLQRDEERLEQLIDRVRALIEEGRHGNDDAFAEANAVAQAAVNLQPGEGTAAAALFTTEAIEQLNRAFRLRALRADRFLETLYQVELAHVPFPDEPPIRYPAPEVWRALTERRQKWASVDLHRNSPAEERIQAALTDQTEIEFLDTPLREAMDFLSDLHNITIILDEAALTEEGIATDEPISRTLSGITLRSAMRIMLEPLGLTYVIEDEVMKITTQLAAEEKLSTRVYPVGDLVIPIMTPMAGGLGQGLGGAGGFGGMGGMGGGQFGMGGSSYGGGGMGGGFGGGFYSVPAEQLPAAGLEAETGAVEAAGANGFAQATERFDNDALRSLKKKR